MKTYNRLDFKVELSRKFFFDGDTVFSLVQKISIINMTYLYGSMLYDTIFTRVANRILNYILGCSKAFRNNILAC